MNIEDWMSMDTKAPFIDRDVEGNEAPEALLAITPRAK